MKKVKNGISVEFKLDAPKAHKVMLAGTFNNWDTKSLAAKKKSKGAWLVKVDANGS